MSAPIPTPPSIPFLGHVASIEKEVPLRSFQLLAEQYGDLYQLNILTRKVVIVNSYELMNEACDEKRFYKYLSGPLAAVRNGLGDGLFTAWPHEHNWGVAHRLLMPAFSTVAVRGMFDDMLDLASQLVLKWERFGPQHAIDPSDDFTRLTFDTITLCSMSHRLNSFYRETTHPFVQAMVDFLVESGLRANRPAIVQSMMFSTNTKYEQDIQIMADLADEIIADRKANPIDKPDLLNTMLHSKDPKTGETLSDESIRYNLLTFLVAGHETTSGTLSFVMYYLLKYPHAMRKAREEVDGVLGDRPLQLNDLGKLPYLNAILRETTRLQPTAPMRTVRPLEDEVIGGKYFVGKDTSIVLNNVMVQRDPRVWGDDALDFRPERMLDDKFEELPPNAWQPFGFGSRACIGRPFAWQEALMALACIIQKFDLVMDNPSYELELKQTLTIKPAHFFIRALPRERSSRPHATLSPKLLNVSTPSHRTVAPTNPPVSNMKAQPLYVLYGSNTGTCESFAQRVASDAIGHGFRATIGTLDSASEHLAADGPVIIVTASFEGAPADNAARFVDWLSSLKGSELANIRYAVFGCGNRDWVKTYQRIPTLCDKLLDAHGATRLLPRGEGDASASEFFETFDQWEDTLWEALTKEYGTTRNTSSDTAVEIKILDIGTARASALRQPDASLGSVIENRVLTAPGAPVKRHIEFELPGDMTFRAGDYLAILPTNPSRNVHRALARFGMSPEQQIQLGYAGPTSLPTGKPVNLFTLLSGYVELGQPATTRDLRILLETTNSDTTRAVLRDLSASYAEKVMAKRLSVLDILEDYPDIELSLGTFLQMLPSMRIRQYSISSSPLYNPQRVTLTISVVDAPPISGRSEPFLGVASTYLASLRPGDKVQLAVRASAVAFHPPAHLMTPMVMFCAGSGLAPMRGFLQERAMQKKAGRDVSKSLLFLGCRTPTEDYLYANTDLKEWVELGVVDVRPAFSRSLQDSFGCKYVQDRIWHDRADISAAYEADAKFFACGSGKITQGIKEVLIKIIKDVRQVDDIEATAMFDRAIVGRYATDVFD